MKPPAVELATSLWYEMVIFDYRRAGAGEVSQKRLLKATFSCGFFRKTPLNFRPLRAFFRSSTSMQGRVVSC